MAAREQGNRKTMKMKKNLQKKRQAAAKQRKNSKKQKKRQAPKAGHSLVLTKSRMFAAKILFQMPNVLMDVFNHMFKEVESLMQNKESPTLDPAEVQAVLKDAMTRELKKHSAAFEGVKTAAA